LDNTIDHADISIQENIYTSNTITIEKYVYEKHNLVKYMIDTNKYYISLEQYFSVLQLETILPYMHKGKFKSVIIDLLFSDDKVKIQLAINLIKNEIHN
jgi:hypothetical protein